MQKLASGVTVLTYLEADAHNDNVNCVIHIRFSNDGGATWTDRDKDLTNTAVAGFPMYPPGGEPGTSELGPGDPHLILCPNGDLLLHMWLVKYSVQVWGTYQTRSTDGGITWTTPTLIEFIGLDAATNLLTFMTDDYFVYDGVIYSAARTYSDRFLSACKSVMMKSTDNGATWEYITDISDHVIHPTEEIGIEYIGNNTILAILRHDGNAYTWKSYSYDMGVTWTAFEDVTAAFEASGRHRVYTEAHLKGEANWWADTRIIVVGFTLDAPGNSHPRTVCIWTSDTRGVTWTKLDLDTSSEDGGYGDIIYNPAGSFTVVSYRGTRDAANLEQYSFAINWN